MRRPPVKQGHFPIAVTVVLVARVVVVFMTVVVVFMTVVVVVMGAVIVPVPLSAQVQDQEDGAGGEQDAADGEVGVTGDGGAELEPDTDHHPAEQQGHHDVGDGGGQRQARRRARAVVAGAGQHRQRQPVVGHHRVPEAHPGGAEQEDGEGVHALNNTLSYSHQ